MSDYKGDQTIGEMTLDEVSENDQAMMDDAIKNSNRFAFESPEKAVRFVGGCIGATLIHLGIPLAHKMDPKMLDTVQESRGIVIEKRQYPPDQDVWKSGIYIYKKDILAAFISEIFVPKKSGVLVNPENVWMVITNAKVK
jgi:hypothetical protein